MNFHQITTFTIIIAWIAIVVGIADVGVTIIRKRVHRTRNIIIGSGFVLVGILIIWLSGQGVAGYHNDLVVIANNICDVLLFLFVVGMFILRAAMDVHGGQNRLSGTNLSTFTIWSSTFKSISGVIIIVLFVCMLLLFFSQLLR